MSEFLIGFTVLVVFVLFYVSKRLICSGPNFSNTPDDEDSCEVPVWTSGTHHHYCDTTDSDLVNPEYLSDPSNNNNNNNFHPTPSHESYNRSDGGGRTVWPAIGRHSQVENRLRSQVFHMILAENEYRRLEVEAARLARLLSSQQGINPDDYIQNIRNELSPLTSLTTFRSPPGGRTEGGGGGENRNSSDYYHADLINYDNNNDVVNSVMYQENNRESQLPHFEVSNEQQSPVRNGNILNGNVDSKVNESNEKLGQSIQVTTAAGLDECNNNNNNNDCNNLTDNKNNCNV